MKTIQITMDERLLARLDNDPETKRDGRSAVLRRAAEQYLHHRRRATIARNYQRAYGENVGIGAEFDGWESQGVWPKK